MAHPVAFPICSHCQEEIDEPANIKFRILDPSRPINDNCGWEHVKTDLTTFHDYSDSVELSAACATMSGILELKGGHEVFTKPIYSGYSGSVIVDKGARHTPGAPVICTEFGGVNIAPPKDSAAAGERDWGYTTASDPADFLVRFEKLVMAVVKPGHICGLVWTQLYVAHIIPGFWNWHLGTSANIGFLF